MKIPNYRHLFTQSSLERANDYIDEIENISLSPNGISCKILGTYKYKIEIAWNTEEYTELSCSCPYDYGGYCKHIAAVLKYVEEEVGEIVKYKKVEKPEWQQIIENLSENELRYFLLKQATDNEQIKSALLINYSQATGSIDIEKYKAIIDNIYDSSVGHHGYLGYEDVYGFSRLIDNLQYKAKEYHRKNKFYEAFSISAALAEQCLLVVQEADDSSGEIGGIIYDAFNVVEAIFTDCKDKELQSIIFSWVEEQMRNSDYRSYGCDDNLYTLYFEIAKNPLYIDAVFAYLDQQLKKYKNKTDWSDKYEYNKLLKYKISLLESQGKVQKIEQLIDENLDLEDFRKKRVEQFIASKDYAKAIAYIKEGVKISEADNSPGITHSWNKQLLDIYQSQKMVKELQQLSKQMFLNNTGSIKYYKLYKSTFDKEKWEEECRKIVEKVSPKKKQQPGWFYYFPSDLAAIYIEEKMWSALLEEVKRANEASVATRYLKYLKKDYPAEMLSIFESSIGVLARNTGRDIYEDIKTYLKDMSKIAGGEAKAKSLRDNLLAQYKNRLAMREILGELWK